MASPALGQSGDGRRGGGGVTILGFPDWPLRFSTLAASPATPSSAQSATTWPCPRLEEDAFAPDPLCGNLRFPIPEPLNSAS